MSRSGNAEPFTLGRRRFAKGVVIATYEPAGDVPTGTFETKEPSEAELERREKWAREDA